MSEVAGRLAGAGRCVLPDASGRRPRRPHRQRPRCPAPAKVVVLGAGVSGRNAAAIALGMRGGRLAARPEPEPPAREVDGGLSAAGCRTVASNTWEIEKAVTEADLVIGAVLVAGHQGAHPGGATCCLVESHQTGIGARRHLDRPGRMLRGLAADDACRPGLPRSTTSVFYCVANMPGAVATHLDLRADQRHAAPTSRNWPTGGWRAALAADPALAAGPEHRGRRGWSAPRSPRPTATTMTLSADAPGPGRPHRPRRQHAQPGGCARSGGILEHSGRSNGAPGPSGQVADAERDALLEDAAVWVADGTIRAVGPEERVLDQVRENALGDRLPRRPWTAAR